MQYAILILLILAVILLLILIFRRSRDLINAMEQQLSQAKDALLEQERLMQQEWSSGMHQNIRTMGEVESVTSSSFNDLAILEVELKSTVRDADVEQCWDMLFKELENPHSASLLS